MAASHSLRSYSCNIATAAILAGGSSTRMGAPKALLLYRGKTFLETIAEILLPLFDSVLIVGDSPALELPVGTRHVPDLFPGLGPLGGIDAALAHAGEGLVFICAVDMPAIRPEAVRAILDVSLPDRITIAQASGRIHPLFGVYPATLRQELARALDQGERRIRSFLDECSVPHVLWDAGAHASAVWNINTQEDYHRLE